MLNTPTTTASMRTLRELQDKEYHRTITKIERWVLYSDIDSLRERLTPNNANIANRFEKNKWEEAATVAMTASRLGDIAIVTMLRQCYEGHEQKERLRDIIINHGCESRHLDILKEALSWPGENPGGIAKHLFGAALNHENQIVDLLLGAIKTPKEVVEKMATNSHMDKECSYGRHIRARECFLRLLVVLPDDSLREVYEQQIAAADTWGVLCVRKTWSGRQALQMNEATPGAAASKHLPRL